ncbi:MAG: hypothetical protein SGPRY_012659 [Prymnesium sp.]
MESPKLALLLLGCSRVRYLYHSQVSACSDEPYGWHWHAPARFQLPTERNHSIVWEGRTYVNTEMAAGALCRADSPLYALAYLSHYGVSTDRLYHRAWRYHLHEQWADGASQPLDSVALTTEAVRRFARNCPPRSNLMILYSSLFWDLARKADHFRTMPVDVWADEYSTNYSLAARRLQHQLLLASHRHSSAMLWLVADYDFNPSLQDWAGAKEQAQHRSLSAEMALLKERANGIVQRTARDLTLPILDLQLNLSRLSPRILLRADGVHPTTLACEHICVVMGKWSLTMASTSASDSSCNTRKQVKQKALGHVDASGLRSTQITAPCHFAQLTGRIF